MTIKAWWRSSTAGLCQQIVLLSAALLAILIAVSNAHAATYTWTGSGAGSGSIWDTASNWGGVLPSATGDLAEFNGANGSYLGGPLTLSYSTGGFAGGAGNAGLSIYLAANQTAPVQINANTTASCRLNNITLDPGAGAFTLGSGVAPNFAVTLGGGAGTRTFTNNSSNTFTINAGVVFGGGSAGAQTIVPAGTGNFAFNNSFTPTNGSVFTLAPNTTGVVTLAGTTNLGAGVVNVATAANATTVNLVPGATLIVNGGGSATNGGINLGAFAGASVGIMNQSGGTVALTNGSWNLEMGELAGGYGAYNISAGTLYANEVEVGDAGYGLYNQTGGSVTVNNWFLLARNNAAAYGVANFAGGQFTFNGVNNFVDNWAGLGGCVNVSGSAFASLGGNNVLVGGSGIGGVMNLNGGTLQASALKYNNGIGSINFNGGLLVASSATSAFITSNANIAANVYSSGGTISNNGLNITIPAALLAPSGSGVTSIAVSGTGFTSPPLVYISGGGGSYATGLATIGANGNLTGITITNPGINYTSAPTITLYGGGGTLLSSTISLAALSSGGMTFQGSGTTTLTGANTYTGLTSVNSGVLIVNGSPTGGGNYNFLSGATLAGTGTISGGTVSLNSGAGLSPGNNAATGSIGTLTLPNLSLAGGGTASFDLSGTATTVGSGVNDLVSVTNNLSLAGTTGVFVNLANGASLISGGSYGLFTYGGAASGFTAASFMLSDTGVLNSRQSAQFINAPGAIDLVINGVAGNLIWVGASGASWDNSGGTTNWFNTVSNSKDRFVTGDNVTFSSTSSGIVTISAAVVPNSVDVTGSYTFSGSGKITGITAVTVQSPAALVIANTNDYTGGTNIQGGTISLGTNNGLPIAGTLTFGSGTSNGTFDLAGHNQQLAGLITAAAATSNQIVTASTGSSTLNYAGGSNYSQFLGSITDMAPSGGTLGLTISSGTLDMTSGTTNYFGATTITGSGVLLAGSIPNTSSISVASAGTLSIAVANASYAQSFSNSGNVVFGNTSGTITLSNPTGSGTTSANGATLNVPAGAQAFGGGASLYKTGTGTLMLTGSSTYSGGTTFDQGTIQAGPASSQPNGFGVGDFVFDNAGNSAVLDLNGQNISIGAISQPNVSTSNAITNSASGTTATLTVGSNGDTTTFAGVLRNGAGTLALATGGGGTFTLTNTNTYTGGTFVGGGGVLSIPQSYSLPAGQVGFTSTGGILSVPFSLTVPSLVFTGSQTMYAAISAPSVTVTGGALQLGSSVAGAGSQTLDLTGVPTFVFSASAQPFNVGGAVNATPASSATMLLASTNTITAASFGVGAFTNQNFSAQNTGTVYLGQANTINANSITVGYNKNVGLVQFQSGLTNPTLVIRNTAGNGRAALIVATDSSGQQPTVGTIDLVSGVNGNSVLDAMISNGTIGTTTGGAQPSTGNFLMGAGTLDAINLYVGQSLSGAGNSGTFSTFGGLVKVSTLVMGDQESTGSATGNFTLDGGGTLMATSVLPGAGAGAQNFNWNDGTIENYNSSGSTTGLTFSLPSIILASAGTHTLWIDAGQTGVIASSIVGGGGAVDLIKDGPGTAVLNNMNNYFGNTNIVNGKLLLTKAGALSSGTVSLSSGTLGGLGTIYNSVVVASSPTATVEAGDSSLGVTAGTLSIGSLTFNGSGNLSVSFGSTQVQATSLAVNGGAGAVVIQNTGEFPLTLGETPLVYYSGSIGGTGSAGISFTGTTPPRVNAHLDFSNPGVIDWDVTSIDHPVWTGSASSTWSTQTIPNPKNWVLAVAQTTTDFLPGDNVVFDDTAVRGNVQINAGNVQPSTVTFNNNMLTYTISGSNGIADATTNPTSLTLAGTGLVVLANSNSYTGGTYVNGGTLQLGNGTANGIIAGGVADNSTLVFAPGTVSTTTGVISGSGAVAAIGPGMAVLTAANTYTGGTTVSGGTLQLAGSGSVTGNVTDNAVLGFNEASNVTFAGVINGAGALTSNGTGLVTLTASNGYTGTTYVNAGTLAVGSGTTGESLASTSIANNASLAFNHTDPLTYSGAISGSGTLTKQGAGTLTLLGSNNYTGLTTLAAGVLNLASSTSLVPGNMTFQGGTLEYSGSGSVVLPGAAVNSTAAMNFNVAAGTMQLNGSLANSNTAGLLAYGPGTLVLASSNNYTGGTTIGTGQGPAVILAAAPQSLGSGAVTFDSQGNGSTAKLELAAGASLNNPITLYGRNSATVAIENLSGSNSLSGGLTIQVGGADYWIQSDSGLLTISGGTAITSAAGGSRTVSLFGAGNGLISGAIVNGSAGTMSVVESGAGTWTLSGNNTYNGSTTVTSGTLVLASSDSYIGGTFVDGGTLIDAANGAIPNGSSVTVAAGGTLSFDSVPAGAPVEASTARVAAVPEPGTLVLLAAGMLTGLGLWHGRKRPRQSDS